MEFVVETISIACYVENRYGKSIGDFLYKESIWIRDNLEEKKDKEQDLWEFIKLLRHCKVLEDSFVRSFLELMECADSIDAINQTLLCVVRSDTEFRMESEKKIYLYNFFRVQKSALDEYLEKALIDPSLDEEDDKIDLQMKLISINLRNQSNLHSLLREAEAKLRIQRESSRKPFDRDNKSREYLESRYIAWMVRARAEDSLYECIMSVKHKIEQTESLLVSLREGLIALQDGIAPPDSYPQEVFLEKEVLEGDSTLTVKKMTSIVEISVCTAPLSYPTESSFGSVLDKLRWKMISGYGIMSDLGLIERMGELRSIVPKIHENSIYFAFIDDNDAISDEKTLRPYREGELSDEEPCDSTFSLMRTVSKVNRYFTKELVKLRAFVRYKALESLECPEKCLSTGGGNASDIYFPVFAYFRRHPGEACDHSIDGRPDPGTDAGERIFDLLDKDEELPSGLSSLSLSRHSLKRLLSLNRQYSGLKEQFYEVFKEAIKLPVNEGREFVITLDNGWVGKCKLEEPIIWMKTHFQRTAHYAEISTRVPIIIGESIVIDGQKKMIGLLSFDPSIIYYPAVRGGRVGWVRGVDLNPDIKTIPYRASVYMHKKIYLNFIPKTCVTPKWVEMIKQAMERNDDRQMRGRLNYPPRFRARAHFVGEKEET